ncbi:MAG: rhodanese-like domain-containing protein [Spirochaetia bacterium]|nr:rhodanese-like domain-containing protein [Spirochaetia bacterium]
MNKVIIIFIIAAVLVLVITSGKLMAQKQGYKQISQAQAKEIMDTRSDYILLDVRTEKEFVAGHIKGAILIPDYEIRLRAEKELPDKAKTILVYCRSGRRSKLAARDLAELGYTDVLEFGGIIDWKYGIEK